MKKKALKNSYFDKRLRQLPLEESVCSTILAYSNEAEYKEKAERGVAH